MVSLRLSCRPEQLPMTLFFNLNALKVKNIRLIVWITACLLSMQCLWAQPAVSSDSIVKHFLMDSGVKVTEGNQVKLLKSGKDKFADLFEEVRRARHHVHLEYFNFRNDSIANALFALLAEKVKEGVEVRALFDDFGNMSNNQPLKNSHLRKLRRLGIQIYAFDPIRFPYVNHVLKRDHRKIVVIDGRVAYMGGMNVADYYINGTEVVGKWRDMHMRVEGPAVAELQLIFMDMWKQVTHEDLVAQAAYFPQPEAVTDSVEMAIVDRYPGRTPKSIRRAYVASIDAAQRKIQLINPYFVPTHSIKKALKDAIDRGIDVEIMISAKSDIPFTPDASTYFAYQLAKRGARVYLYNGGFHHSKIMMVDDIFCTLGSANLNSRSLRYDYEVNAFMFNRDVTDELIRMFEDDKLSSTPLTREVWMRRTPWKRFVGWFANLFAPFL